MNELVSIIMPTYNSINYLEETIESVINQTYNNWELLICDDGSNDGTFEFLIKESESDERVKVFTTKINSGAAVARQIALENSRGRYIAFIDSDDLWDARKLEKQINFMKMNNYYFTATSYNKIDVNSTNLNKNIVVKKEYKMNDLLKSNVGNLTVIYDSKKLGKPEIPKIKKRNDYLYWLSILEKNDISIHGLDEILASYRIRPGSLSSTKVGLIKYHWYIYRSYFKFNFLKSIYLCVHWMTKGVKNKLKDRSLS